MFVIDFLTAVLLALSLSVFVTGLINRNRSLGVSAWTGIVIPVLVLTWIVGIVVTALGPAITGTHWIPFALAALTSVVAGYLFASKPAFRRELNFPSGGESNAVRLASTGYFIITLLLFFSAVTVSFYLRRGM